MVTDDVSNAGGGGGGSSRSLSSLELSMDEGVCSASCIRILRQGLEKTDWMVKARAKGCVPKRVVDRRKHS